MVRISAAWVGGGGEYPCVFVYGVYSVAITALEDTRVFEMYA